MSPTIPSGQKQFPKKKKKLQWEHRAIPVPLCVSFNKMLKHGSIWQHGRYGSEAWSKSLQGSWAEFVHRPLENHLAGKGRYIMHLISKIILFFFSLESSLFFFNIHDFYILHLLLRSQTLWNHPLPSGGWSHSWPCTRPEGSGDDNMMHTASQPLVPYGAGTAL